MSPDLSTIAVLIGKEKKGVVIYKDARPSPADIQIIKEEANLKTEPNLRPEPDSLH